MQKGTHRDPSVFTHFFPGIFAGFVLGGITGSLIITQIATSSLHVFWQTLLTQEEKSGACLALADVQTTVAFSTTGKAVTSITWSNGEDTTLLNVLPDFLRVMPSVHASEAYLLLAEDPAQIGIFPATAVYRMDLCRKRIDHLLGTYEDPLRIVSMSAGGSWIAYQKSGEAELSSSLYLMQSDTKKVFTTEWTGLFSDIRFSPQEDALVARLVSGERFFWNIGLYGERNEEHLLSLPGSLPGWGLQTADEYLANLQ